MKRQPGVLCATLALTWCVAANSADSDARYAAIKALGALNGVALQCRYVDQVRRMKAAVVTSAPKERSFGLAFDQATNSAFLAFIQERRRCPGPLGFEQRVGEGIDVMRQAFNAE